MRTVIDLWRFTVRRKKYWLMPLMIIAVVIGALGLLTKGSLIGPLIYTLF